MRLGVERELRLDEVTDALQLVVVGGLDALQQQLRDLGLLVELSLRHAHLRLRLLDSIGLLGLPQTTLARVEVEPLRVQHLALFLDRLHVSVEESLDRQQRLLRGLTHEFPLVLAQLLLRGGHLQQSAALGSGSSELLARLAHRRRQRLEVVHSTACNAQLELLVEDILHANSGIRLEVTLDARQQTTSVVLSLVGTLNESLEVRVELRLLALEERLLGVLFGSVEEAGGIAGELLEVEIHDGGQEKEDCLQSTSGRALFHHYTSKSLANTTDEAGLR
ncbi:hypothetical protein PMAYCL1PPCAC_01313, partial [Pristionchus mayeri]